ncbi:MAG: phosphopyruvate hydratase [Microgenomates group bacterium]
MRKIKEIKAIEILDSRGHPTIGCFLKLDDDSTGITAIPSGASTGSHEAFELRDGDKKRYFGKGVLKAVENINQTIAQKLKNARAESPEKIDRLLIELDGTENKSRLGANAILAVSQALIKALAVSFKKPLWQFLNEYYFSDGEPSFPRLMVNLINGGKHANWNFDLQEFMISPVSNQPSQAVRIASEIFHQIGKNLKEKKLSTLVGDEGGYSPNLSSNEEALQLILKSAQDLDYQNEKDFNLALDSAASEFYQAGVYLFKKENKKLTTDELINYYLFLKNKFKIFSFEDPFAENDWVGFKQFTEKIFPALVVGDDLYTTDPKLIAKGIKDKTTNTVLIKPNQIGTIFETVKAINLAKKNNWHVVISHRSGETEDSFIADLAYAAAANFIKTGSMSRSERLVKYNRLIEIENFL